MRRQFTTAAKRWYTRQQFIPTPLGIFCNPLYILRRGIAARLRRHLPLLKGVMLDFGCGSKPYRSLVSVGQYIGLEVESNRSRYRDDSIEAFYDGTTLPFASSSFDSILTSEVLEHIFNIDDIVRELRRVLKPGGVMIATVPLIWGEHETPHDCARYTTFGLRRIFEQHGFEVKVIDKSTTSVETICQLAISYIADTFLPSRGVFRVLLIPIIIGPLNLLALLVSVILPKKMDLYHNNIVVARKMI